MTKLDKIDLSAARAGMRTCLTSLMSCKKKLQGIDGGKVPQELHDLIDDVIDIIVLIRKMQKEQEALDG